jgi:hypothetical protein
MAVSGQRLMAASGQIPMAAAGGPSVRIGADRGEEVDDRLLASRAPVARARNTDRRGVQRFGAAPVSRSDIGTEVDQLPSEHDVVGECCGMQRGVAFVHLGMARRDEELLAPLDTGHRQLWRLFQHPLSEVMVARPHRPKQHDEALVSTHAGRVGHDPSIPRRRSELRPQCMS